LKCHQKGKYLFVPHQEGSLKIVVFGLTISSSWGNGHATPYRALLRAMHRAGHDVTFYERDMPYYARRRDFDAADFCRLIVYSAWEDIRRQAQCDFRDADAVIHASYCVEGARIIDELSDSGGALRVFYDLDTPITLEKLAASDCEYLRPDQIPGFDLYLSWCGGTLLSELEKRWHARRVRPLYGCVDPETHARVEVPEPYRCRMSYMGTYAADRQQKFEDLFLDPVRQRPAERFVLAGSLYPEHTAWPRNLWRYPHVSPQDHSALYSGSRITLNLTRDTMARAGHCPSGRLFEAAACGTPIVSDWFEGLDDFFSPQSEILIARDTSEVLQALDSSDEELSRIATRALDRTIAEHTGDHRAQQLIGYLEEARDGSSRGGHSIAEVA
jgi:spore maturation protein CgeB